MPMGDFGKAAPALLHGAEDVMLPLWRDPAVAEAVQRVHKALGAAKAAQAELDEAERALAKALKGGR